MTKLFTTKLKSNKGFTLIEILVVISIIGILIAISIFGLQGSFESARDAKRKSDLKEYQSSLENYANKNNSLFYLAAASIDPSGNSAFCTAMGLTSCPTDPKSGTYNYCTNANATSYVLWGTLENPSGTIWIACSNGKTGVPNPTNTVPTCGASFNCQLP